MPHGHVSRDAVQIAVVERLRNQTHTGVDTNRTVIRRCHSRGFLTPVLQSEQSDGRQSRAMSARIVYAYYPALLARVVKRDRIPLAV